MEITLEDLTAWMQKTTEVKQNKLVLHHSDGSMCIWGALCSTQAEKLGLKVELYRSLTLKETVYSYEGEFLLPPNRVSRHFGMEVHKDRGGIPFEILNLKEQQDIRADRLTMGFSRSQLQAPIGFLDANQYFSFDRLRELIPQSVTIIDNYGKRKPVVQPGQ